MWGRSRLILATLKPTHCSVVDLRPTDNVTPWADLRCIPFAERPWAGGQAGRRDCGLQVISSGGLGGLAGGCDHGWHPKGPKPASYVPTYRGQ